MGKQHLLKTAWYEEAAGLSNRDRTRLRRIDKRIRYHHVPNWFRRAILAAKKRHGWYFDRYTSSGWEVFSEFKRVNYSVVDYSFFDHWGSYEEWFVTQPYTSLGAALSIGCTVAELLDLEVETYPVAPWFSWTVWVAFRPKQAMIPKVKET